VFFGLGRTDEAFERKQRTRGSENPRVLAELNDPPIV